MRDRRMAAVMMTKRALIVTAGTSAGDKKDEVQKDANDKKTDTDKKDADSAKAAA